MIEIDKIYITQAQEIMRAPMKVETIALLLAEIDDLSMVNIVLKTKIEHAAVALREIQEKMCNKA